MYIIYFQTSLNSTSIKENEGSVQRVEKLMAEGEYVVNMEGHTKVIAIIGMPRTGKSTFKNIFLKDPNLQVVRARKNSKMFLFTEGGSQISAANETYKSKTLIPNVAVDSSSGALLVEFPSFSDTRGAAEEIAAIFMMKNVLDKAEQVKFVVMENHAGLSAGSDKHTIRTILRHLAQFFPDVDRLNGSIALIANKAQRLADMTAQDEEVHVTEFLENFKIGLVETPNLQPEEITKMIKLIDIFNDGGNGDNIAVIFKPNKEGSAWDIDYMNDTHDQLKDLVQNKLKFANNTGVEYDFNMSDESVALIKDHLLPAKTIEIENLVSSVMNSIRLQLHSKMQSENSTSRKLVLVRDLIGSATFHKSVSLYSDFFKFINSTEVAVDEDDFKKLVRYEQSSQFYLQMAPVPQNNSSILVQYESIDKTKKQPLKEIATFFEFLNNLEAGLQNKEANS